MTHNLKAHPDSFELLAYRKSEVQLRKNDRNFQVGDVCRFFEWMPDREQYSGKCIVPVTINTVLDRHEGLAPGWCLICLDVPKENITWFNAKLAGKTSLEGIE